MSQPATPLGPPFAPRKLLAGRTQRFFWLLLGLDMTEGMLSHNLTIKARYFRYVEGLTASEERGNGAISG